ncbi:MAG: hypothetical protein D6705_07180 [Deltaproteobacteria bacterium]|nr:MAG: hypothetical protein D6705_07180 [Deltaproteobacteria bacterium]
MSQSEETPTTGAHDALIASVRQVLREVVEQLPDEATLGELVDAARKAPMMERALGHFTVAELIEAAQRGAVAARAQRAEKAAKAEDATPQVIRRRADVPDGDIRVLACLASQGPVRESEIATLTKLTSDQARLVLRNLKTRGFVHFEGSGAKRRVRITRSGSSHLRRVERESARRKASA